MAALASRTWVHVHPLLWTHENVQEWIFDTAVKRRFPELILQYFMNMLENFDGRELREMTLKEFQTRLGGFYGELIWNDLQNADSISEEKWTVLALNQWTKSMVKEWIFDKAKQYEFPEALRRSCVSALKNYDGNNLSRMNLTACQQIFGEIGEIIFEMLQQRNDLDPGDEGRAELSDANILRLRDSFAPGYDLKSVSGPSQLDIRSWNGRDVEGWINLVSALRDIPLVNHLNFLSTLTEMSTDTIVNLTESDFTHMDAAYGGYLFDFLRKLREVHDVQGEALAGEVANVVRYCLK